MPVKNGVGFSDSTLYKQECLRQILLQHMIISRGVIRNNDWADDLYIYIDMNAGRGKVPLSGINGSPLIFLQEPPSGLDYLGVFIEKDRDNFHALISELEMFSPNYRHLLGKDEHVTSYPIHGDSSLVLTELMGGILDKPATLGLIYSDPNGVPPFEALAEVSQMQQARRVDILIYMSGTTIKRVRKKKLFDYLQTIDKKEWLIRRQDNSSWQWTFLFGTNWADYPGMEKIDLVKLRSNEGIEIFKKLNFTSKELLTKNCQLRIPLYRTYREYLHHPDFLNVRDIAFRRSRGKCECCREKSPTEVHHLVYPEWGTIERDARFLLAICHKCHCEIHRKDS